MWVWSVSRRRVGVGACVERAERGALVLEELEILLYSSLSIENIQSRIAVSLAITYSFCRYKNAVPQKSPARYPAVTASLLVIYFRRLRGARGGMLAIAIAWASGYSGA